MQRLARITPDQTGIALFIIAAVLSLAAIISALLGAMGPANIIIKIAAPTNAAAIGVLVYLALLESPIGKGLGLDEK